MSIPVSTGESYPGHSFSISQHLYATKRKLRVYACGGSITTAVSQAEVSALEQDALEVLGLIQSMKNHFAPINRIPPDILSLIPKYWDHDDMDKNLVTLTHVCRGWRELLIARSWLWTHLDCTNVDKTRVYIERAKSSRMEISLFKDQGKSHIEEAFLLAAPRITRFKFLTITGTSDVFRNLTKLLTLPAPSLEQLIIDLNCNPTPVLDNTLFGGDLPSLHTLRLKGVVTDLPWKTLGNLTIFELVCVPDSPIAVTRFLDFLESAPRLRNITLLHSIPPSSDAPPGRVVSLPHLKGLSISAHPTHSILLNHISIPAGSSLLLDFNFSGDKSPLPDYLPRTTENLQNLSRIAIVKLRFDKMGKSVLLFGPSGGLHILGYWKKAVRKPHSSDLDREILHSLDYFTLSWTERMVITKYKHSALNELHKSPPYYILNRMGDLRTLTLIQCNNLPFILALDPWRNPSGHVLCPKLEELVIYVKTRGLFNITELMHMARERASRNVKLSLITIIGLGELIPGKEVFKLREHVARVEYRVEEESPRWDATN